jgi:hypothetical protein
MATGDVTPPWLAIAIRAREITIRVPEFEM